jgi:hypothetical protein
MEETMKHTNFWMLVTCLLFISGSMQAEKPIGLEFSHNLDSQSSLNTQLVGAWWLFIQEEGFGFYQIVFYPDGSYCSNVLGILEKGRYQVTSTVIRIESNVGKFNLPYKLRGVSLQIQLPGGVFTFARLSDLALDKLKGHYCGSGEMDHNSSIKTDLEFDGRGVYKRNGVLGLYWVHFQEIHLIYFYYGNWAQWEYIATGSGRDRRISAFSGQEGNYARCN